MVKYGLKIYYYSGDFDGLVPIQGTLDWLKRYRGSYGATVKKSWRVWSADDGKSTSGMVWELDGITFWSVFGAGHMAAYDKPREMKYIVDRLLD
jgi:serine carboxypeptidase-like clade 2